MIGDWFAGALVCSRTRAMCARNAVLHVRQFRICVLPVFFDMLAFRNWNAVGNLNHIQVFR
ncbi:hypothetical protein ETAA8_05280 [Anatilimnocola aggregata]|uniref:Uncharacterized protein n=1 Tax=Anatilimnocola aggregata TaxID=2528021 RepID=A0A517Y5J4_9BACT|nr:hypothetical protein ETAA8_05280 [Anatilimnocola aggregata]